MKNHIPVIILFLICSNTILCQSIKDSLVHELENAIEDTTKIRLMCEISVDFIRYNPADIAAIEYAKKSIELSEKIGFYSGVARSCYNLGVIYQNNDNYSKSLEYLTKSRDIYENLKDKKGLAKVNNAFGKHWYTVEKYEEALKYFEESNLLFKEVGDLTNVGATYLNMGAALDMIKEYDLALEYIFNALNIFDSIGEKRIICSSYLNIGEHYELRGEWEIAEKYYMDGLKLSKEINARPRIADSFYHLGRYYYKKGDLVNAKIYLDSAYNKANELESLLRRMEVAEYLEHINKTQGNIKEALMYAEIYNIINDSLNKIEISSQLAKLEWERDLERERQLQDKILQRQKLMRNFSIIAVFLVIIILVILYRNFRIKKKTNQLLSEIDELKSRMFSNISHEFRTPLTLILGPLDEMIEEGESKRPSTKTLKMMRRNASRLLALVNQMLDLSKMDAGKLKLVLVENDIVQALRAMILSFSSLAEQKHIHFEHEMPDYPCITWFDPDKLEKIVNNLLSNAFKFTPENGIVKVVAKLFSETRTTLVPPFSCENPVLELSVEDTGKGIPKEHLEKVFDRFHQVEGTSEIEQIGTGIGLALTKELLNLMHGNVTVESTPGKGSKFKIILPLGKNHLKEKEFILIETEQIPDKRKTKIQEELQTVTAEEIISNPDEQLYLYADGKEDLPLILIVDDHPDIRTHVRQKLKKFRVLEAADGKAGLDISIEYLPDLIVTDLMMPNMDGVEFCKKLKTDERTSHIPVIMLTAKASVENRIEGLETGADDYITKPFNMKELLTRINNLIGQRQKLRERFSREVTLQPKDIAITSADEKFLNRTIDIIEKNMGDGEFDVASLREEVGLSHMQLFRKLKALTDQAPGDFIRTIRLKRAAQLMQQKFGNIAEITYEVGFNNLSYFAKCFREMFGMSPSEYIKNN